MDISRSKVVHNRIRSISRQITYLASSIYHSDLNNPALACPCFRSCEIMTEEKE